MSGEFLSLANLNHLISITNRFLYDKYNFRMMETVPIEELRKEWQMVMLEVHQNFTEQGMGKEFQKMNMKVLSTMKDRIKERYQLQITAEKAFTNAVAQQSVVVSVPVQGNPIEPEERILDNALEEDEFMDKVRILENQRRSASVAPIPVIPSTPPPPLKLEPAKPLESNYTPVVSPTPIPLIPVVGSIPLSGSVPSQSGTGSSKKGRIHFIPIHAKDRNWVFSPPRQSWVWSGSLPTNANLGSLRLSALMVPYWVSNTPFITVEITGAGGQKMRCVCLFKEGSATRGWLTLKPLNRSDEIRPLATPWTISLFDAFDVPLALGEDIMVIKGCEVIAHEQYRISLNTIPVNTKIAIGDIIEVGDSGVQATVMRDIYIVHQNYYLFLSSSVNLSQMVGKNLLVKSAQPSLIFELSLDE
jgi:hypothetical protein